MIYAIQALIEKICGAQDETGYPTISYAQARKKIVIDCKKAIIILAPYLNQEETKP